MDDYGNLYIADTWYHRVLRVDPSGRVATIAGIGYSYDPPPNDGDGGLATAAYLRYPTGIAMDSEGLLYILDDRRIRKVLANGTIITIAGSMGRTYGGDGGDARSAGFTYPRHIVVDQEKSLYVAGGAWDERIRKIGLPSGFRDSAIGEGFTAFSGGMGHVFLGDGKHEYTKDPVSEVRIRSYGYDADGKLNRITNQFGQSTAIHRSSGGRPYVVVSPEGIETELTVDANNNLTRIVFPDGSEYSFAYDGRELMTDEFDPNGNHFVHRYDALGKINDVFDPAGGHWNYLQAVNTEGVSFTSISSAEGQQTQIQEAKNPTGGTSFITTQPDGSTNTSTYSDDFLSVSTTTTCGMKQDLSYGFDPDYLYPYENRTAVRMPSGVARSTEIIREYTRDTDSGLVRSVKETHRINGRDWVVVNDRQANTVTTTSPLGRISTTIYNPSTLLPEEQSTPGLLPVSYAYDAQGRLAGTSAGSRASRIGYDSYGHIDYVVGPDNQTRDYTVDVMGRLRSEVLPDGSSVGYEYDANGNMVSLLNQNQAAYSFAYTANDQRANFVQPLSGSYGYSYDRDRRLTGISAPSGRGITNFYTGGNLATITTSEGVTSYDYLCGGRLESAAHNGERVSFNYDGSLVTSDIRSGTLSESVGYSYNGDFAVSGVTYAGSATSLGYDNDGLLVSSDGYSISRNAQNGLPEAVSGQGLGQSRSFNGYGELDGVASSVSGTQPYSWIVTARDNAGRIRQRQESIDGGTVTWDYSYDAVGRLLEVEKDGSVVESYSYDLNGNRLTETNTMRGIMGQSFTHSAEDHLLTAGADSYVFDVDGFLQNKTSVDGISYYDYSSRGELLRVDKPDGTILGYVHDPSGRRIAKQVNGTTVEKYLWKDQTTLLAVYDGDDNLLQRYTYVDARVPVSMTASGATYHLLTDQVGTLRAVADTSGAIVKRIDYDSFGNIINDTNPSFSVPFGFAGGLHDRDTGLVRFGYRDYSPELGRFVAKDPIDFAGGDTNLYAYVANDPVNWIDPPGLSKADEIIRGAYKFVKYPGDIFHGGEHWHVYARRGGELLGRLSAEGRVLTGAVPKNAIKILAQLGKIGGLAIGVFLELATPAEAAAPEIPRTVPPSPFEMEKCH